MAMPTALASPWRLGSGLDAGRVTLVFFGMAGRERAELAEALDLGDSSSPRSR